MCPGLDGSRIRHPLYTPMRQSWPLNFTISTSFVPLDLLFQQVLNITILHTRLVLMPVVRLAVPSSTAMTIWLPSMDSTTAMFGATLVYSVCLLLFSLVSLVG